MKKTILTIAIAIFALSAFSQKIGLKFPKQTITVVPAQTVTTDTIAVRSIVDDGVSVIVILEVGRKNMDMTLWSGKEYITNMNWTNESILAALKNKFNIISK